MCLEFKIKSTVRQGKAMKNANGVVDKNGILCEAIDECGNINSYLKEAHDSLIHFFEYFDKCTVFCRRTSI